MTARSQSMFGWALILTGLTLLCGVSSLLVGCNTTASITEGAATIATQSTQVRRLGAQVTDKLLDDAVWWFCDGTSAGSLQRRWGNNSQALECRAVLCSAPAVPVLTPVPLVLEE